MAAEAAVPEVADTAVAIARIRAEEGCLPPAARLFEDPYAALFAEAGAGSAVAERLLSVPYLRESVRLRTRFIDDAVRAALADGIRQLVVLGAGFDTRALRLAEVEAAGASVFEVDLPQQLARKAGILAAAAVSVPPWVRAVPCDFAAADFDARLVRALAREGLRRSDAVAVVWEGVIGYLDDAAVDRSLRLAAGLGGPGTRLVFNYQLHRLQPADLAARVAAAGFAALDDVEVAQLHRRWLADEPPPLSDLFRVAVARR